LISQRHAVAIIEYLAYKLEIDAIQVVDDVLPPVLPTNTIRRWGTPRIPSTHSSSSSLITHSTQIHKNPEENLQDEEPDGNTI
jgi:hypothetical protein